MSELYYKHKETGQLISLDRLKESLKFGADSILFLGHTWIHTGKRIDYEYMIRDIPLSDDFEPLMKPLFTENECHEMYRLFSKQDIFNQIYPPFSHGILVKLENEIKKHEEYKYKHGGSLDEI